MYKEETMDGSMQISVDIPNKSTFKINEVCALTGIKSYVLRYWETEFDEIAPISSSNGHKLYERKDIEIILLIKKLLFDDKLTVEKARVYIKKNLSEPKLLDERFLENNVNVVEEARKLSSPIMQNSRALIEEAKAHFSNETLSTDQIGKLLDARKKLERALNLIADLELHLV